MLILKQNAANSVPTPPAGKGTIFLDDSDVLSVKTSDGNVENFPTVAASNSQVLFMNGTSLSGEAALTYDFNNNVLNISGNIAAGNVKTDNLLYANGVPWDLSDPGGSNTEIQFNDDESFGGSAAFTFNKSSNLVTVSANLNANNLNATVHITSGNVWANSGTISAQTLKGEAGNLSNITAGNITGQVANSLISGTVYTNAQPNITSVGTLTSVAITGNATAGNVYANSGTIGASLLTGTLTTAAQPNVTSVGTLTSLSVTGNANTGNIGTAQVLATANVTAPQLISNVSTGTAPLVVSSTTKVTNLNADTVDGYDTATSATASTIAVRNTDGNISANYFIGNGSQLTGIDASAIQNGTSNVRVFSSGNVTTSVAGTANVLVVTATGANIDGTLNTGTGNANVGNLGTAQVLASANVTAPQLISNISTGTAPLVVTSTTQVANLNVANAGHAVTANTVVDAAQPNITSVGTLTSVAITGNATAGNVYANSGTVGAQLLTGTLTTAAQPNITSVGSLTSLTVTGNADANNFNATTHVTAGNVWANSGTVGASLLTGTLTTAAQPNITSTGTLTSLAVTGNVTAGNVYANSGTIGASLLTGTLTTAAQPNITSVGTLTSATVTGNVAAGNLTTTGVLSVTGTGVSSIAGNLDMTSNNIINLATPVNSTDAATKQYVDDVAQGLNVHDAAAAATTGTLAAATGGTITYNNGSSGVGATLTTTGSYTTIDGVNVATVGTRILVKNEANAAHNGIYTYTSSTVITRATDYDSVPEVEAGDFVFVTGGTSYDNTGWVQTSTVATIGTDNIDFTQFSGAGTYNAGTGLTLTGTTFSVNASQTQVTAVGTLGSLAVTGNGTFGNVYANSGTVGASLLTGTLTTAAQPNITSVGSLSSLTVTGNAGANNFNATTHVTAGNVWANSGTVGGSLLTGTLTTAAQPNITSVGTLTSVAVTGNVTAGNVYANSGTVGASLLTGTLTTAAQPNVTSLGTLSSLTVTGTTTSGNFATAGNITASFLVSNVATGTAPLTVTSTTQVANLNVATSGTAGTVTTAAQPNITSVGTLTGLGVNGTVTAVNITANTGVFTGNANGISSVQAANIVGTTLSSTVVTSSLTTVGTLGSLNVSGNITAPNLIANTGFVISSVNAAVSAAGTVQGNATALTRELNVTSTVASGAGVALPTAVAGMRVTIINTAANAVLVYPASGGTINSLAQNAAFSQGAGAKLDFVATSTTQWYTLNATYL